MPRWRLRPLGGFRASYRDADLNLITLVSAALYGIGRWDGVDWTPVAKHLAAAGYKEDRLDKMTIYDIRRALAALSTGRPKPETAGAPPKTNNEAFSLQMVWIDNYGVAYHFKSKIQREIWKALKECRHGVNCRHIGQYVTAWRDLSIDVSGIDPHLSNLREYWKKKGRPDLAKITRNSDVIHLVNEDAT